MADYDAALAWYKRLAGRPPDLVPRKGEAAWRPTETGWIHVVADHDRRERPGEDASRTPINRTAVATDMPPHTRHSVAAAVRQRMPPLGRRFHRREHDAFRPPIESSAEAVVLLADFDSHGIWFVDSDGERVDPRRVTVALDGTTAIDGSPRDDRPAPFASRARAEVPCERASRSGGTSCSRLVLRMAAGDRLVLDFETPDQASAAFTEIYRNPKRPTRLALCATVVPADVRSAWLEAPPTSVAR